MSANKDSELSETKPEPISKRKHLFLSAINNVGLQSVQTLLAGMIGAKKIESKNRFNVTVAGKRVTVITNGGEFGLFEWFPTEIKLKIWNYALEAPRIVSVSFKNVEHSSSSRDHVRLFYSDPRHPQLYVNCLTRQQAIQRHLARYSGCTSGSRRIPKTIYNAANDTLWLRKLDFWLVPTYMSCLETLYRDKWMVQSLAITPSSRDALMDREYLHCLSTVLAYFFKELRELIVIMDYHDLTTPGLPDEITFINLLPESFSKHCAVTNYSPTTLSMCEEFIVGTIYGEWKPDHWYTLACSLKHSLKSHFMWKQETIQKISNSTKNISADDLYYALRDDKIRAEMLNPNPREFPQIVELLRKWTVPSVKILAATTYK
ncbi:hypothetical protein BOTNAR_0055g00090 [Botryotinia narcissicola]|uniref:2EXR domain-containing protein n=1 Tax=Botryotinia narcissicola TaxID=278944 RepID=A0A4Z1JC06_9HELO|nr:hypothetical protein BOTNAR_0055g00090 [Botryotinia narcissicola]